MTESCKNRIIRKAAELGIPLKKEHYLYSESDWPIAYYETIETIAGDGVWFSFVGDIYHRYETALNAFEKMQNVSISYRRCHVCNVLSACFMVMETKDHEKLLRTQAEEKAKHDDWWERYHNADTETRRLMACGKIK